MESNCRRQRRAGWISIRKGIKHKPWVREHFQKDSVFLSPSSIGPNLNISESIGCDICDLLGQISRLTPEPHGSPVENGNGVYCFRNSSLVFGQSS